MHSSILSMFHYPFPLSFLYQQFLQPLHHQKTKHTVETLVTKPGERITATKDQQERPGFTCMIE